jgi:hypothetical protein
MYAYKLSHVLASGRTISTPVSTSWRMHQTEAPSQRQASRCPFALVDVTAANHSLACSSATLNVAAAAGSPAAHHIANLPPACSGIVMCIPKQRHSALPSLARRRAQHRAAPHAGPRSTITTTTTLTPIMASVLPPLLHVVFLVLTAPL